MIISPCADGRIDPVALHIVKHFDRDDVIFIPITHLENYVFNHELYDINKPYILIDYTEYSWTWDRKETHLYGVNTDNFDFKFCKPNWNLFDSFIKNKPPLLMFKRELLKKDVSERVLPIEYPCFHKSATVQTEEQFLSRPVDLFFNWGYSHELRRVLHGNIFSYAPSFGYQVIDNFENFEKTIQYEGGKLWASIYTPYFSRIPMERVLGYNGMSKLSVSLAGAGRKCFRHSEATVNSIMIMPNDNLAWSYQWRDWETCFKFDEEIDFSQEGLNRSAQNAMNKIKSVLATPEKLYQIYINSLLHIDKYQIKNYSQSYINEKIKEVL